LILDSVTETVLPAPEAVEPPNAYAIVLTPLTMSINGPPASLDVKYIEAVLPAVPLRLPTLTH